MVFFPAIIYYQGCNLTNDSWVYYSLNVDCFYLTSSLVCTTSESYRGGAG